MGGRAARAGLRPEAMTLVGRLRTTGTIAGPRSDRGAGTFSGFVACRHGPGREFDRLGFGTVMPTGGQGAAGNCETEGLP